MLTTNLRKLSMIACFAAAAALAASDTKTELATIAVQGGTATFVANTNVAAVSVKGKSSALVAKLSLRRAAEGLQLEHIDARLSVQTLLTGMGLRDSHMRKYVFTTADGQVPDLHFEGANTTCSGSAKETTCPVAGMLTIRNIARPFTLPLKIREDGAGFKASGDGVVKLSAYGIEQPSELGVKMNDEILLHFDFAAKPVAGDVAMLMERR
ncbi:MAG TPA: YceI family protein [Candidatus Acidoferrales bacterium]|jgi:polyisoprenoid-binding protein YceI|nr:YceI family protein [Candidatus Acidoferrales bacterium]